MATRARIESDAAIPPGELLLEELQARGLTQKALAAMMGRPPQAVSEVCQGKKALTAETALDLEAALGIPAHIWVSLEGAYRMALARRRRQSRSAQGR